MRETGLEPARPVKVTRPSSGFFPSRNLSLFPGNNAILAGLATIASVANPCHYLPGNSGSGENKTVVYRPTSATRRPAMDDSSYSRVVKLLAERHDKPEQSMTYEALQSATGLDEKECRLIIARLNRQGHVQVTPGVQHKFVVLASIVDYNREVNKPRDLLAWHVGRLNTKWWWAYPKILISVILLLAAILGAVAFLWKQRPW